MKPSRGLKFLSLARSLITISCLHFLSLSALADELIFLKINHPSPEHMVHYSIKHNKCRLGPLSQINVEVVNQKEKTSRQLHLLEKVYYGVENQTLALTNELTFSISSLINAKIRLSNLKKTNQGCQFDRVIEFQNRVTNFEKLVVHYEYNLNFPTLDYIEIYPKSSNDSPGEKKPPNPIIQDYQARGYFPFHEFKLGLAVFNHTNIRPDNKKSLYQNPTVHEPMPAFMVRYGPLFLNHNGLGALLLPFKNFSLLTAVIREGKPYRGEGLRERRRSFYFGPLLRSYFFEFQYFKEVAGINSGETMKFIIAPEIEVSSNFTLSPRIYYQLWDKRYVDYYFGISESELGSPHAPHTYSGTREHNWGYFLRGTIKQKKMDYFFQGGFKVYGGSIRNSPLATKAREYQLTLGILYSIF